MVARLQEKGYLTNIPFLLRARGRLRIDTLTEALQLVVDRHAVLRSVFVALGETLMQRSVEGVSVTLPVTDVSAAPDPLAVVLSETAADGQRPFGLGDLPRLRSRVFQLGPDDHVVSIIVDHLAADGVSLGILSGEWRSLYQSLEAGTPFEIPPTAPQYRDYALWQHSWLAGAEAERQRQGWLADLEGLPASSKGGAASSYAGVSLPFELDATIAQRLSALCVRHRVKPFVGVLAAYAPLLAQATGERDPVIGTVRANRRRPETRAMVGHFANLIPLRIRIDDAWPAVDLIYNIAAVCSAAYAREELPFQDLAAVAWRRLAIPASRLGEFSINFVPFPAEPVAWGGDLRMEQLWGLFGDRPLATSRATLFVRQQGALIGGTLIYDENRIDPTWAAAFPRRLGALIVTLAESSALSLAELLSQIA
jgi:arthrofactin-type cyclic lipopeptide synthetase C